MENKFIFQTSCISLVPVLGTSVSVIRVDQSNHKRVIALYVTALTLFSNVSQATPTGGEVVSGTGSITQSAATTTVKQATQNLSVNWKSFNVAPQEVVNFVQPSTSSIAVNRILDTSGSQILGSINANGQVYLINPNGILFGQGAQVNVRGLVASALDFNDDQLSDNAKGFFGNGTGSIINQGNLTAANGGYVALLGSSVTNQGLIKSPQGSVMLGAGNNVTLSFENNNLLKMQVNQSLLDTLAENGGLIQTAGGQVIMNAGAKNTLQASVVNNTGVIEAHTLDSQTGKIILLSGMELGTTDVSGTLDASAPNGGNGGFIDTSAAHVKIIDGVKVSTLSIEGNNGTWLIDPADFNIGSAADGAVSNISGATLSSNLGSTDVVILSSGGTADGSGDINVNEAVSWSANKLTLTAAKDVNINAVMTANGSSTLALNTGTTNGGDAFVTGGHVKVGMDLDGFLGRVDFEGAGTSILSINGAAYNVLNTKAELRAMAGTGNFALGANLDFTSEANFVPIAGFANNFNGLGHTITGMNIAGASAANTGMIKVAGAASDIRNVGLVGGVVSAGGAGTGGLAGSGTAGVISHSYNTGAVTGAAGTGGLVGSMTTGKILNSFTKGAVTGAAGTGGLVGTITTGLVDKSYATGAILGAAGTGGLIGSSTGVVNESYATGSVQGNDGTGGLTGTTTSNTSNSYATGSVAGATGVGGLLGTNTGNLTNNYASGVVTGNVSVGGLIGTTPAPSVSAGILINNFWDTTSNAHAIGNSTTPTGTMGVTSEQLTNSGFSTITESSGSGSIWDFVSTWLLVDGASPMLRNTLPKLVVTSNVQANIYSGEAYTLVNSGLQYSVDLNDTQPAYLNGLTLTNIGTSNAVVDVGTYSIKGRYAGQARYNISYVNDVLTINPKTVSLSANKTYDGNTNLTSAVSISTGIGTETLSYTAATASDANVVTASKYINSITLEDGLNGGKATNYILPALDAANAAATITTKALTVSGLTASNKVYDGNTNAGTIDSTTGLTLTGLVSGDIVTVAATGTFDTKNVGVDKTITLTSTNSGADVTNYNITDQATYNLADITPKALTVSGLSASNKVYDGDTEAGVIDGTGVTLTGLVSGDALAVAASGTFDTKNVGVDKTITLTSVYSGADVGNYTIADQATYSLADITPKALTVSGLTASDKIYDGNTNAGTIDSTTGLTLTGLVTSDTVAVAATGTFDTKNVGVDKTITLTSVNSGVDVDNYTITDQSTYNLADITTKALSAVVNAANKVYDGLTTATATLSLSGMVGAETLTTSSVGSTFNDKNVADTKTVTINSSNLGNGTNGGLATNYSLATGQTGVANITTKALVVSGLSASDKVYDGNTGAGSIDVTTGLTLTGLVVGDNVTVAATGVFDTKNAGVDKIITLTSTNSGDDVGNYAITDQATYSLADITTRALSVTGLAASNKIYDGNTVAAITGTATVAALDGDDVSISGSSIGAFDNKNVGTTKAITITGNNLSGADADNYNVGQQTGLTADVTAKALTVSGLTANDRAYDRTRDAGTINTTEVIFTGLVSGDEVTVAATGTFDTKNKGVDKTITLISSNSGADVGNYTITDQATYSLADITTRALTVSGLSASNKPYDGNTAAVLTGTPTVTALDGDDVSISGSSNGNFDNKHVGNGKAITITGNSLSGFDSSNYNVGQQMGLTADVTTKGLTVSGLTANDKVYDGTTDAGTINTTGLNLTGLVTGDTVAVAATGTFDTKNVGVDKTITLTSVNSGADAGNYTITAQATYSLADITTKALSVIATAANKIYDSMSTASATLSLSGMVGAETLTTSSVGSTFNDKNVASNKTVTINTANLGNGANGGLASNYSLATGQTTLANITSKALTVSGLTASNKVYDGNAAAALTGTATVTALSGDDVSINGTSTGAFDNKNVGNTKAITITGNSLSGADAANYNVGQQMGLTADVTTKTLTVSGLTTNDKVYDSTTDAGTIDTAGLVLTGLVAGDIVAVSATGTFDTKNVGVDKTITLTSTNSGADVGNYTITDQATYSLADITTRAITLSGLSASNKTYDGNTVASITGTVSVNALGGDDVSISGSSTGAFDNKNVDNAKAITISGNSLSGNDAANYTVGQQTGLTADVTAKGLTVSGLVASDKVYDGTTDAGTIDMTGLNLAGLVVGDLVAVAATGTFDTKNVGVDKTITLTSVNSGADVGNYLITDQATLSQADITTKDLTVSGLTANDKVYDRTTDAGTIDMTGLILTGLVAGDTVAVAATGSFDTKNVGVDKTITLTSNNSGADVGNYAITDQATYGLADITTRALTVSGLSASNKIYDGNTAAAITGTAVVTALSGDNVSISGSSTGTFDTKHVDNAKAITISGNSLSGNDAANYTVGQQTGLTADVTAKALNISGIAASDKVYDGTTDAGTIDMTGINLTGLVAGDTVAVATSGTFDTKNVGVNKTITLTSINSGADVGNYTISGQATYSLANITTKALSAVASAANKVYDVMTTASATLSLSGMVGAETLTTSSVGSTFNDKNVANDKTVTINSANLGNGANGGLATNYSLATGQTALADITQKSLTVSGLTASDKVYDGNTVAALTGTATVTILGGDTVTLTGISAGAFANKNIGINKAVTVSGNSLIGEDAANYTLVQQAGLSADISILKEEAIISDNEAIILPILMPTGCVFVSSLGSQPKGGVKSKARRGVSGLALTNLNDLSMSGSKTLKCG